MRRNYLVKSELLLIVYFFTLLFSTGRARLLRLHFYENDELICEASADRVFGNDNFSFLPARARLVSKSEEITPAEETSNEANENRPLHSGQNQKWIAFLNLMDNRGKIKQTSILEEVKNAFILGASAVVILAMNAEYFRKLNFDSSITKPVVFLSSNITRILRALTQATTTVTASWYETSKGRPQPFSKLTLWSTCGRMSTMGYFPWEGTICMEPQSEKAEESHYWTVYYAGILLFCLWLHFKSRRSLDENNREDSLYLLRCRQLAVYRLKEITCTKYAKTTRGHSVSSRSSSRSPKRAGSPYRAHSESCAICLEDYRINQTLRILPCSHRFHSLCVDAWLIDRQTCPLCIVNVFDLLPDTK